MNTMVIGSDYVEYKSRLGGSVGGGKVASATVSAVIVGAERRSGDEVMMIALTMAGSRGSGAETKTTTPTAAVAVSAIVSSAVSSMELSTTFDIKGGTAFLFALYFLMVTQDVAVNGWTLTMLSDKNRGKGPLCNSKGQDLGYFLSFVGFLALNDTETAKNL